MATLRHVRDDGTVEVLQVGGGKAPAMASAPSPAKPSGSGPHTIAGERGGQGARIGIFWSQLCGGGVETVNRDLAVGLSREKYIVDAYVWQALDTFLPLAKAFDSLTVLNEPLERFSPQERLGPYTPIEQCAGFQKLIREREYDAFIVSCCWAPFWVLRMHCVPLLEYWHGYGCWNNWRMPSDAIVAVSETTLRQIEVNRPEHAPASVVYNAVDFQRYSRARDRKREARERFRLHPTGPVMLYCGRFAKDKRPEDAMKAFVEARKQVPDLQLLMVGFCGNSAHYLRVGSEIGLNWGADARHYTLPQEEIELAYAAADVMIHPSQWEGLGMVLLEGLAAGVPIVSTCAGGCGELLKGVAIQVAVGDTADMGRQIARVLGSSRLRDTLIRNGQARVRDDGFDLQTQARKVEEIVDGLIQRRPQPMEPDEVVAQELVARGLATSIMERKYHG